MRKRPLTIIGNWKMHKTIAEAAAFVKLLSTFSFAPKGTVGLAVPFTALYEVNKLLGQLQLPVIAGAQNMSDQPPGAFTGEISAEMLKEAGARFVLLGHSERRHIYNESNALINRKVKRALSEGLTAVVCVGEKIQEHQNRDQVLQVQLLQSLEDVTAEQMQRLILAYEPVWAIGTGVAATPADAESAHSYLRSLLQEKWGKATAETIVIQYGGSVTPDNAKDLLSQQDVDGLLVGGASLKAESFYQIITKGVS